MRSASFDRFGGLCAILAGIGGFGYAVAFVIISQNDPELGALLSALLLLLNGLFATAAITALYGRVQAVDGGFAMWALLLAVVGQLGAVAHGGYDLANALYPPSSPPGDLPFAVDPRGLFTFGLTGLALIIFAWLMLRGTTLSRNLAYLGYVLGVLLLVIYVARLTIVTPTSPVLLLPVLISGFLVNPLWYLWLGRELRRTA